MRTNIKDPERILLLQVGAGGGGGPPAPASVALTYSSASVIVTSDRHHGPQAARYFVFYVCICKFVCQGFDFGILPPPLRSCHIICETPSKINITPQCVQNIQCYKKRNFRMGIYSVMALKITWLYAG